jgi:hypothetical protein
MRRYRLIRREEIELVTALPDHSCGLVRSVLIGADTGAVDLHVGARS